MHAFHFDILFSKDDGRTASHYLIHPEGDDVDEGSPVLELTGETLSVTPPYQVTKYVKLAWMSPSELVYFWVENSKVVAILSTLPSSKEVPNQLSVGILWKIDSESVPDADVCPFSGCVCLLNRPRRNRHGSVQVMDYI
jgi:hypothetical protein